MFESELQISNHSVAGMNKYSHLLDKQHHVLISDSHANTQSIICQPSWTPSLICLQARRHVFKSCPADVRASALGTSVGESTRGGNPPLVMGAWGISPEKFFDLWLPLFAFLMHFGCVLGQNFSRLGLLSIQSQDLE